jgi:chromate transporter
MDAVPSTPVPQQLSHVVGSGSAPRPTFAEALRVWGRIGITSFGGPAGQIALMHRTLVDEKKWIDEQRYLSALNFCMLLPGPEAMQLATYVGWRLHGLKGGLAAGLLFVLPGALVVLTLSVLYAAFGKLPLAEAVFVGVKAAVLAIVIEALLRVARRALKGNVEWLIAGAAFVGIFFLKVPFPLIVAAAALVGFWRSRGQSAPATVPPAGVSTAATLRTAASLARHLDRAAARRRRPVRQGPRAGRDRLVLLQAGGGDVRRRLCGAGLHGAGRGRALPLASSRARCSTASASPRRRRGRSFW